MVGVFVHDDKVLMLHRPTGGLWSALWEFPNVELKDGQTPSRLVHRLASTDKLRVTARLRRAATVHHELTHRSLTFVVYVAGVESDCVVSRKGVPLRWVTARGFRRLSISTAHRKIFAALRPAPLTSMKHRA